MAFNLPFVLTAASVGLSAGLIIHYFTKRNEEIFVTAEDMSMAILTRSLLKLAAKMSS